MKNYFSKVRQGTIFRSTDELTGQATWIMWFHRVSVLKYAFFFVWGFASIVEYLPSLRQFGGGDWLPFVFALLICCSTLIAGTAAAIWPARRRPPGVIARTELHAAMFFVALVVFYFLVQIITGVSRVSSLSLILSYASIPALRAAIIFTGSKGIGFRGTIKRIITRIRVIRWMRRHGGI